MTTDSAPPREPSSSNSLDVLLQRKLPSGDCARWKTVLRLRNRHDMAWAREIVALARLIDPDVQWRVAPSSPMTERTEP